MPEALVVSCRFFGVLGTMASYDARPHSWAAKERAAILLTHKGNSPSRPLASTIRQGKGDSPMADAPRITVDELKRRMEAGEDFTVIDVRNPQAWAESDTQIPEAIRVPLDELDENLPKIPKERPVVAYCT